jgi:hypothetical protein
MHTQIRTPALRTVPPCLLQLTVSTVSITALRGLVMRICGEALGFMRIEACDHGERMRVWLSLSQASATELMGAVMRALPEAEFGRLSGAKPQPGPAGALQ